jgi:hypothetical protein
MTARRAFALSIAAAVAPGCDPREAPPVGENGPPFLIVGRSAQAAQAADGGTALYVQARGGNWVAIHTTGCTHSVSTFSNVTRSCSQVPYYGASPLDFVVDRGDEACIVTTSLYSICDCDAAGIPDDFTSGDSYYTWCDSAGTLVTTDVTALGAAGLPADGGGEGGATGGDAGDGGQR